MKEQVKMEQLKEKVDMGQEVTAEELRHALEDLDQNEFMFMAFFIELLNEIRGTDLESVLTPDFLNVLGRAAGRACHRKE